MPLLEEPVLRSDGKSWCEVRQWPGGRWTGTCPGFDYRKTCKHIDKVRKKAAAVVEPDPGLL
jgi:hypothetical protein